MAHIDTWIFDLDNTLYPASSSLFPRIDARMEAFIADRLGLGAGDARAVQKRFFHAHGTTLRGLMNEHGVDPTEFLDFVHDVEMEVLGVDARVVDGIAALPGRKLVFTNADATYANRVLAALGLAGAFEAICDIHATGYRPKPDPAAYAHLCAAHGVDPHAALFVEDMARNLTPAKAIGMTTVWVDNGAEAGDRDIDRACIDLVIRDVGDWLASLAVGEPA